MVHVHRDLEELSRAAARLVVEASRSVPPGSLFSLALAGGRTPRRTYALLAEAPLREQVEWGRVQVFWGDERCVRPDDPQSNERTARQALLDRVPVPNGQVHPIQCAGDSPGAARRYEALLRTLFPGAPRLDLVLLGLGEDGHTASLKPGTAAVEELERWAVAVPDRGEGFDRVTLTLPVLNQARVVAFLVSGAAKADVLREVLEGPAPQRRPAGRVRPVAGEIHWFVDQAAASRLRTSAPQPHPGAAP